MALRNRKATKNAGEQKGRSARDGRQVQSWDAAVVAVATPYPSLPDLPPERTRRGRARYGDQRNRPEERGARDASAALTRAGRRSASAALPRPASRCPPASSARRPLRAPAAVNSAAVT
eukprot:CAMPEP_0176290794 /NCGR_PEP_ID=MMETSP0121_2-20121125/55208_1 /TAXON_ID=160619 /ORGANISM="Kryptoperidinium foliaceum, Strain CCMP 1326" /LENGTH=118 /DNA_ID=CAMNT_0017631599 /DNA_START=23 /DNA_END=376 /DNA_ORIENTATION=-